MRAVQATAIRTKTLASYRARAVVARPSTCVGRRVRRARPVIAPSPLRSQGAPSAAPSSSVSVAEAAPKTASRRGRAAAAARAARGARSALHRDRRQRRRRVRGRQRIAHLTLDPKLQLFVNKLLAKHKVPQAAVVMIEPSTGKVLAYASRERAARRKDLNVDAFAPSASVFKVVTGAALVQIAGVSPELKLCYSGGEQKITPGRSRRTIRSGISTARPSAQAMGRSINTVFARLASRKLTGPDLHAIASQLGYGAADPVRRAGDGLEDRSPDRSARLRAHGGGLLEHHALSAARRDAREPRSRTAG